MGLKVDVCAFFTVTVAVTLTFTFTKSDFTHSIP